MAVKFKLAEILLEKGISNKSEFARKIGMHRWGVFKLVTQEPKQIETGTIEKLCRALDILPNDLFEIVDDDTGKPFLPTQVRRMKRKHRKVKINVAIGRLSKDKKMALAAALFT